MSIAEENKRRHDHGGHEYVKHCNWCGSFVPDTEKVLCSSCKKPNRNYKPKVQ